MMNQTMDDQKVIEFLKKQVLAKLWIEEVLQVKLGDDLGAALKNGIVLCYLISEIEPGSIPNIQVCLFAFFLVLLFFHRRIRMDLVKLLSQF